MANSLDPAEWLLTWVDVQVPEAGRRWLRDAWARVKSGEETQLAPAFALAPRRLGRAPLELAPADREAAEQAHPGWRPWTWTVDEAARACLLLALPLAAEPYYRAVDQLFRLAAGREQMALLRSLPLLPRGQAFIRRAAEGVRSNSEAVLAAIAFDNPYPAEHFSEAQWNRMVLKCLFLDLPLDRVIGLSARMNGELARMVGDLVRERSAAGRPPPRAAGCWAGATPSS